ncbi:MAG: outer membrane protein transport protein [Planctomycetota bacterium]|nr:outer membrane protein transport protein [Planctomycetota bacterium]
MRTMIKGACVVLPLALFASQAEGAGFGFSEHNVRANGMGGAYTGLADDPSAIYYNPAGLGFLRGMQGVSGVTVVAGRGYYRADATANNANARSDIIPVPHGFGSLEINDKLTLGGGIHAPFGLQLSWPQEAETRYSNTLAAVRFQHISIGAGYKVTDQLSLGGTFSYVTTRRLIPGLSREGVRLQRKVDLAQSLFAGLRAQLPASVPDSAVRAQARGLAGSVSEPKIRLKGDGDGFGWSIGFLYKPSKVFQIGATYRSEVSIQIRGDADFSGVQDPAGLPPGTLTNSLIRNRATTSVRLPRTVGAGISSQLADRLTLSFQLDWTDWRSLDSVNIRFKTGRPQTVQAIELKWNQAFAFRTGLEFLVLGSYEEIEANSLKPNQADQDAEKTDEKTEGGMAVALRLGYAFDQSPVPGETLTSFLPDNDRHISSLGVGFDMGWVRIDLSAQYFYFKTVRRKNQTEGIDNDFRPTIGKFTTTAWLFGGGVTLRF